LFLVFEITAPCNTLAHQSRSYCQMLVTDGIRRQRLELAM